VTSAGAAGTPNGIRTRAATLRVQSWSATEVLLANLTRTDMAGLARLTAGQCAGLHPTPRLIWPVSGPGGSGVLRVGRDDLCVPKTG
jgi:hypothetical protein